MITTRRIQDPLGRSHCAAPRILVTLCATAAITGSAWPIHARSVSPALDTNSSSSMMRTFFVSAVDRRGSFT